MRGLDPRIHQSKMTQAHTMDCRVKPGNDDVAALSEFALARCI